MLGRVKRFRPHQGLSNFLFYEDSVECWAELSVSVPIRGYLISYLSMYTKETFSSFRPHQGLSNFLYYDKCYN